MKIEEVLEKIKNMSLFDKLDFLMKIYNEVEDKKSLEDLIRKTVEEISSERTPVFIDVEFKSNKETKSRIEEIAEEESGEEEKKEENKKVRYEVGPKFIEKENEFLWVGEKIEKRYENKNYKTQKSENKYKVMW